MCDCCYRLVCLQTSPAESVKNGIWFTSHISLRQITANDLSLQIGNDIVTSVSCWQCSNTSTKSPVLASFTSVAWNRFDGFSDQRNNSHSHLCVLLSRLDYCNAVVAGLHDRKSLLCHCNVHRMQRRDQFYVLLCRSRDYCTLPPPLATCSILDFL